MGTWRGSRRRLRRAAPSGGGSWTWKARSSSCSSAGTARGGSPPFTGRRTSGGSPDRHRTAGESAAAVRGTAAADSYFICVSRRVLLGQAAPGRQSPYHSQSQRCIVWVACVCVSMIIRAISLSGPCWSRGRTAVETTMNCAWCRLNSSRNAPSNGSPSGRAARWSSVACDRGWTVGGAGAESGSCRQTHGRETNRTAYGRNPPFPASHAAPAIRSQLSAQLRHCAAQSFIIWSLGSTRSQSSAQRRQTSAHSAQVRVWRSEPRSMNPADVRQISAQSVKSRM